MAMKKATSLNFFTAVQRLCSRLTALWRYINFVFIIIIIIIIITTI